MQGLELSERFYKEYGEQMIDNFPHIKPYVAVGLIGQGSECLGYDDDISRDHDFEPGFCIFLPDEHLVSSQDAFQLERAYAQLPQEFMGFRRNKYNPVGGNRHGVLRIGDFMHNKVADSTGNLTIDGWFYVAEQFLLEVTNGKLFCDNFGLMTEIRQKLAFLPEDIRLKKIAGNLLLMEQSGLYNYPRCMVRGEAAAAQLALTEFVKAALHVIFLLNRRYMPYYKWVFRAFKNLPRLSELYNKLESLLSNPNNVTPEMTQSIVEFVCASIIKELHEQGLTTETALNLEWHAYAVNNKISDSNIRNLHIMYAV